MLTDTTTSPNAGPERWERPFLTIAGGQTASLICSSAVQFALIWWLASETESPLVMSLTGLMGFLPQFLLGPVAGVWVDRWPRKAVIIGADLFIGIAATGFAASFFLWDPPVWAACLVLGLRAAGSAFHMPAIQAVVPMLVPREELVRANGWSQFMQSGAFMLGPVLGAAMFAALPLFAILLLDLVGAVLASLTVAVVHIPEVQRAAPSRRGLLGDMRQGIAVFVADRRLGLVTLAVALIMVFFMPLATFYPLMTSSYFRLTAWHAGLVELAYATGMMLGALGVSAAGTLMSKLGAVHVGMAVTGATTLFSGILAPDLTGFALFAALCLGMGASANLAHIPYTAYIQETVPHEAQGRAFSLVGSLMSLAMPVGLVMAGPVAERHGVPLWFVVSGAVTLTVTAVSAVLTMTRREPAVSTRSHHRGLVPMALEAESQAAAGNGTGPAAAPRANRRRWLVAAALGLVVVAGVAWRLSLLTPAGDPADPGGATRGGGAFPTAAGDNRAAPSPDETSSLTAGSHTPQDGQGPAAPGMPVCSRVTIRAAGDLLMHQPLVRAAEAGEGHDFAPLLAPVAGLLSGADLTIANLETTFGGPERGWSGYPRFNTPDELADAVGDAGIDVLTTANNHALDSGAAGLVRTLEVIRSRGLAAAGTRATADEPGFALVEAGGLRVAVLAYTYGTNGLPVPEPYLINLLNREQMAADVEAARARGADLIVAVPHWGLEYQREPSDEQRELARHLADLGVDVIFGAHPHVVQPVEVLAPAEPGGRPVPVFYSMGNFASNQRDRYTDWGIVAEVTFTVEHRGEGKDPRIHLTEVAYRPVWVHRHRDPETDRTRYRVVPVGGDAEEAQADGLLTADDLRRLESVRAEALEVPGATPVTTAATASCRNAVPAESAGEGFAPRR